ncbi:MAG: GGDEF domain-containing protein [Desulfobulbus sp.]|nr:GGDEF domain-containing protein [Desulfobulbus sp.]
MQTIRFHVRGLGSGRAFVLLAALFALCFGVMVGLIWVDQGRVIKTASDLQDKTVPEIIRYQRLARNLEQLRQAGERIFSATTPEAMQQAMFVVTLMASHPSVLEYPEAAAQTREIERFLAGIVYDSTTDKEAIAANFAAWQRLSARLGLLVDDVSTQGVNLLSTDLDDVTAAIRLARFKLNVVAIVVGLFLLLFLVLFRVYLIQPLQHIGKALSDLGVDQPAPIFKPAALAEIQAVEKAIGKLHNLLAENEKARQALEALANRDGLTGLFNRRHFMTAAEAELHRAQRYRRPVIVGMADLDLFKRLNDTYGHAAGDAVLRAFAVRLQENLRQSDLVCRYGGEEFAFLFPEITLADAAALAERCRATCADSAIDLGDGRSICVTFSMGLADASESTLEIALSRADEALYDAKRQGRNRVIVSGASQAREARSFLPLSPASGGAESGEETQA